MKHPVTLNACIGALSRQPQLSCENHAARVLAGYPDRAGLGYCNVCDAAKKVHAVDWREGSKSRRAAQRPVIEHGGDISRAKGSVLNLNHDVRARGHGIAAVANR